MRPSVRLIARATVMVLQRQNVAEVAPTVARMLTRYGYHRNFDLFRHQLKREYAKCFKVLSVEATCARPYTDEALVHIETQISELLDSPLALTLRVDPDILGGIIIETPDKYLDASARGTLSRMT